MIKKELPFPLIPPHAFGRSAEKLQKAAQSVEFRIATCEGAYYQQLFENMSRQRPDAAWKAINIVLGRQRTTHVAVMIKVNNDEIKGPERAEYLIATCETAFQRTTISHRKHELHCSPFLAAYFFPRRMNVKYSRHL